MMTSPGTWKAVLILSHGLNISRSLFLMPTDVFLWDVNPAAEQTPLKGSGLVSCRRVLLVSRVLVGRPILACMHHPLLQQTCYYVRNQSYIPYYQLTQELAGLGDEGLVLWQEDHRGIGHGTYSCNLFLYHAEMAVRNLIFSSPPDH